MALRLCKFGDSLFISDAESAGDLRLLKEHGITHVISALPSEPPHKDLCKYLIVPVVDSEIEDLIPHLPGTVDFINGALREGGNVLIHCAAGISRSSSICIHYLMATKGLSFEDAFTQVKNARSIVCPNSGFRGQLRLFAEMKFAVNGDTLAHRHYRMRKPTPRFSLEDVYCDIWSLVHQGEARSEKVQTLLAPDPAFECVGGKIYACVDCGRRLFAEANIIALHEGRTCAADSITIEAMSWMNPAILPVGNEAPLQCPGCNANIGRIHFKMNWRCTCHLDWSPAFRVRRTKVKQFAVSDSEQPSAPTPAPVSSTEVTWKSLEEAGLLLKTETGMLVAKKAPLKLSKDQQVFRVPGRFCAFDFIKVFDANSREGSNGLYLCGAGALTDESTIREILAQNALGCSRVAIVHDLFDRTETLQAVLMKSDNAFFVKSGILGASNPKRRLVAEWTKTGDRLVMRKNTTELGQYLRSLGFTVLEVESIQHIVRSLPAASTVKQCTNSVLMVVPVGFGYNAETATDNTFMHKATAEQVEVERKAMEDFNRLHAALTAAEVRVTLFVNAVTLGAPDAVFPNNWFSTHTEDGKRGTFVLYPMKAPSRRNERRADVINFLRTMYPREITMTEWETRPEPAILEGTGSMVLDRIHRVCYVALSPRSDFALAKSWAELLDYTVVPFRSFDSEKKLVYHTNVVMSVGTSFAVICADSIAAEDRERVIAKLKEHREVIEISHLQMNNFCGNILELAVPNARIAAMSTRAYNAFTEAQHTRLLAHVDSLVHADISTIETVGGGGVRCMLAELF